MTLKDITVVAYEVLRACQQTIGDFSYPIWDDLLYEKKVFYLSITDFLLFAKGYLPQQIHNDWVEAQVEKGWKYSKEEDIQKKEGPYIVEYEYLTKEIKVKQYLYLTVVRELRRYYGD